jgi:hypothetical protein
MLERSWSASPAITTGYGIAMYGLIEYPMIPHNP